MEFKMFSVSSSILICSAVLMCTVSAQPTYLMPQQRNEEASISIVEQEPSNTIEYQIVPSSEYAIAGVQSTELSIIDYLLDPVTAVISLGSTALSVASWIIINGAQVFLGMAIVIGLCALTPYCNITIELPTFLGRESTSTYLENLEYYFNEAYNKYQEMQKSV